MTINNQLKHIPYLDGLRGISILLVVTAHSGLGNIIPGGFGVTLFFFISGYLITYLLLTELQSAGGINLKNFYLRRFFRLYPGLVGMIMAGVLFVQFSRCNISKWNIAAAFLYFTNYYIGWVRGTVPGCATVFDILWSLSIEEHFYLFYPILILLFVRKIQTNWFVICLLLLCFIPLVCRWILLSSAINFSNVIGKLYLSTHTRVDCILWGCLAASLLFQKNEFAYNRLWKQKKILLVGVVLMLVSFAIRNIVFRETLRYTLQGTALLLIIPALAFQKNNIVLSALQNTWLVFIGKISYSLYLFHWISMHIASNVATDFSLAWQVIFWPSTILLALASYNFIEKPFINIRRRFGSSA